MHTFPYFRKSPTLWERGAGWTMVQAAWTCGVRVSAIDVANAIAGWAKYMEWQYPVEIVVTNKKLSRAAGAIEVAASL
jgi:hypothetical protein